MEMMITEYIKRMGDIRNNYDRWSKLGLTPNEAKAFDFAIDAMRKYQKIKELMDKEVPECIHPLDRDKYKLGTIRKVLEDGNDDC